MKTEREILVNVIWEILKQYEMDAHATKLFINNNFDTIEASSPSFWDTTKENDSVIFQHNINGGWLVVELIG